MKNIMSLPKMPVLRICFLLLSAVVFLMSGAQLSRADETSLLPLGARAFQDMGYAALNAVKAEANRQATGPPTGEPRFRSMTAPHHVILQGNFTPRANDVLLAVFADDGADVSRAEIGADGALGNWVPLVGRLGVGQALPNLAQSFQLIDVPWVANKTYRLRVEYKNLSYTLNTTDIDGLTLFAFNGGGTMTDFVVNVDRLQYRMNGAGEYSDVPNPLIVPVGSSVQFRALPSPNGADWPEGKPVWGGSSAPDVTAVSNNDQERTRTVTFNTVSTTGTDYKTVMAESGNTLTVNINVISVVIEVNLTSAQNDDLVDYRLSPPTECRAKVLGNPQTDLTFVLTNSQQHPDRLTFGPTAASTLSLTLSKDGAWSPTFIIWGNGQSENKNDATIEAHLGTTNGAKIGTEDVTVFWYDPSIIVSVSGYYGLKDIDSQTKEFTVVTGDGQAVDYAASIGLKPSGLDSSAPQITARKVGIIQNVSGSNTVRYKSAASDFEWAEPTAANEAAAIEPQDLIALQNEFLDSTVALPGTVSDSHSANNPLYNADVHDPLPATRTQTVYLPSIGDIARDSDTPAVTGFLKMFDVPIKVNNVQVGTVKYTFEKATISKSFTTWVALVHQSAIDYSFQTGTPKASLPMARTTWTLNIDSSVAATQKAVISLPVGGIKILDPNNPSQLDPNVPNIPIVVGPLFANDYQIPQDTLSGTVTPHVYP